MTSAFSWQNSISLFPVSICTPRSNLPVTLLDGIDTDWNSQEHVQCFKKQKYSTNGKFYYQQKFTSVSLSVA